MLVVSLLSMRLEIARLFWLCIRSLLTLMRTYCVVAHYVGRVIAFYALGNSEVYELQLFVDLYRYMYMDQQMYICKHTRTHTNAYTNVCECVRVSV
jgi:hypothetical protein